MNSVTYKFKLGQHPATLTDKPAPYFEQTLEGRELKKVNKQKDIQVYENKFRS